MLLTDGELRTILKNHRALVEDSHVVFPSHNGHGDHGSDFIDVSRLVPHPQVLERLCHDLAARFAHDRIDSVVSAQGSAIPIIQWMATHLAGWNGHPVHAITPDLYVNGWSFRRHQLPMITGRRVLIVDDVVHNGCTATHLINLVTETGGTIVGVGAFCNRERVNAQGLKVPKLIALWNLNTPTWKYDGCPSCRLWIPLSTDGGATNEFISFMRGEGRWFRCRECDRFGPVFGGDRNCGHCHSTNIVAT